MDKKVFYVTKAKLQQLKKEHDELTIFERNKTVGQEAPRMFESEDISSEFVSYHEDMDSLRFRIEELKDVLEHYEVIKNPSKDRQQVVGIGATVKVDVDGKHDEFVIMGTLEANPMVGKISNESPVGKALLGAKVGDEITVSSPNKALYKIKSIKYQVS